MVETNFSFLNDEELIDLISKRSHKAFKELVTRYSGSLFYFLQYFTINDNDINTLIEELFTEIWQKPYKFKDNFKTNIYKKLLKQIKFKNPNSSNKNHEMLTSLKKQDLVALNLSYFSGLSEKEISSIYPSIDKKLSEINEYFINKYKMSLYEYVCDLNISTAYKLNYTGNIIKNATKHRQISRFELPIIIIGLIPLILLMVTLIYSIQNTKKRKENRKEEIVEIFEYLFEKN